MSSKPTHAVELLARQAANDAPALILDDRAVSYREIHSHARAFAASLRRAGVQCGERVGVFLPNGVDFVVASFGVWMVGGIVLGMHPQGSLRERVRIVEDGAIRILVTHSRMKDVLPESSPVQCLLIDRESTVEGELEVTPIEAAVSQYSTGSSGQPKRVTRTHSQLIGESIAINERFAIDSNDRILAASPMFHSYGFVQVMLAPLLAGAAIVPREAFLPRDTLRTIERARVTHFPAVPFMIQLMAEFNGSFDVSSLRCVVSAGAPLLLPIREAFEKKFSVGVRQLYGTTETGALSSQLVATDLPLSVGVPLGGVRIEIVEEGEIAIRSEHAATAYDDPGLAGPSRFVDGWFMPGDLGRREEGSLVVTGRTRLFINVAGNKVDPGEVEAVLRTHPLVADVAVVGLPDGGSGERVKAVVVSSSPCERTELIEHCQRALAAYKVPRVIEFRSELPRSPLGKLLRGVLMNEE